VTLSLTGFTPSTMAQRSFISQLSFLISNLFLKDIIHFFTQIQGLVCGFYRVFPVVSIFNPFPADTAAETSWACET
jgi:hypothetical protein